MTQETCKPLAQFLIVSTSQGVQGVRGVRENFPRRTINCRPFNWKLNSARDYASGRQGHWPDDRMGNAGERPGKVRGKFWGKAKATATGQLADLKDMRV